MTRSNEFRDVLFGTGEARRFTQDSPVLPDVWIAYDAPKGGDSTADPFKDEQDLLLTPHFGGLSGRAARDLRAALEESRAILGREKPSVAQLPGVVAARLYLDELLRIVLPRSSWWQEVVKAARAKGVFKKAPEEILEDMKVMKRESEKGTESADARNEIPIGFAWLIRVVAFLIGTGGTPTTENYLQALETICGDRKGFPPIGDCPTAVIGMVAINRRTSTATMESALAVKADAARLLFNVSCASIVWAVIDSGIDRDHPAFAWRETPTGAPSEKKGEESRVIGTYDLTLVRQLLDPLYISTLFAEGAELDPRQRAIVDRYALNLQERKLGPGAAPKLARQLCDRLQNGFELDWGLIEPFLWDEKPERPRRPHGTMVAGILAADWRKEPADETANPQANPGLQKGSNKPWTVYMQGICPDIRLYDFRVIGEGDDAGEFEVLAALQLIRHLNEQTDRRQIHGANLSLSTEHDVTSFACGSTLVCQECDRTWASGVVLVAAAGNRGHQHYMIAGDHELGGYHAMSITDPGNAEGVITVGATHRAQPHQYGVSYFSSRGPTGDGRRKPDLVAPGEKVTGPVPDRGQTTDDGTSFAAPHVSGAAAMLMARHAELIGRPQRIKEILCATATDLGRERYFQGAGMLDILRALQSV
jgi:subtilisin family serine protease